MTDQTGFYKEMSYRQWLIGQIVQGIAASSKANLPSEIWVAMAAEIACEFADAVIKQEQETR